MSEPKDERGEPRFNEEQVALILKRAAELQQFSPHAGDSRSMSLPEIERVAQEAGMSAALVRRAAGEVSLSPRSAQKHNPWLGGPREIFVERVIEGEFPTEHFDLLVEAIRYATQEIGQSSVVGRSLSWTAMAHVNMNAAFSVSVSVSEGQTRIRVRRILDQLIGGIFGGVLGGVGGGVTPLAAIGLGALAGPFAALAGAVGFLGLTFAGCRRLYRGKAESYLASAHKLADELERVAKARISAELEGGRD